MSKMNQVPLNRHILEGSTYFEMRGERVKWPTIRGAWLNDLAVADLERYVTGLGRSIIFLDGQYRTNLNQWSGKNPIERAVFFEYLHKHPRVKGGIFSLHWIGDFHNGCIMHTAWQYPQNKCWERYGTGAEEWFERMAWKVYNRCVEILYQHSDNPMDQEVEEFLRHGKERHKPLTLSDQD